MAILRKVGLEKIWNWVKNQLTSEDLKWLKTFRSGVWSDFSHFGTAPAKSEWEIENAEGVYQLSFRIQDVLDAKAKKKQIDYGYAGGLPKTCLVQIAKMLSLVSVDIPNEAVKTNKWELANQILNKIGA